MFFSLNMHFTTKWKSEVPINLDLIFLWPFKFLSLWVGGWAEAPLHCFPQGLQCCKTTLAEVRLLICWNVFFELASQKLDQQKQEEIRNNRQISHLYQFTQKSLNKCIHYVLQVLSLSCNKAPRSPTLASQWTDKQNSPMQALTEMANSNHWNTTWK